jgi:hypothetical protein
MAMSVRKLPPLKISEAKMKIFNVVSELVTSDVPTITINHFTRFFYSRGFSEPEPVTVRLHIFTEFGIMKFINRAIAMAALYFKFVFVFFTSDF